MRQKTLLVILFVSCLLASCSNNFKMKGYLEGVFGKVYLTVYEGKTPHIIDSTIVNDEGVFYFKGNVPMPMLAGISDGDMEIKRFFVEKGNLIIAGSRFFRPEIKISGSPTQDLYAEYQNMTEMKLYDSLSTLEFPAEEIQKQIAAYKKDFVKQHPESVAAAYVFYRELSPGMNVDELRQGVVHFSPEVQQSVYLQLVSSMADAMEKTAIGKPYIDISAPDTRGVELPLSSVVGPGKYVLLDFWASWCPPCRAENPNLVSAYEKYAPKGFEIYAVSLDHDREEWLKGIREMNLTWKHVSTITFWESTAADAYGIRSIPANILIGPDGTILARNLRGEKLQEKLAELLP